MQEREHLHRDCLRLRFGGTLLGIRLQNVLLQQTAMQKIWTSAPKALMYKNQVCNIVVERRQLQRGTRFESSPLVFVQLYSKDLNQFFVRATSMIAYPLALVLVELRSGKSSIFPVASESFSHHFQENQTIQAGVRELLMSKQEC